MFSSNIVHWFQVNVEHLDRFNAEFGCEDESDDDDEKTSKNGKSTTHKSSKPSDWQALFGEKNSDDEFMLGIKHTRYILTSSLTLQCVLLFVNNLVGAWDLNFLVDSRKSIRLYGDFYSSDMIIASPLKLHMVGTFTYLIVRWLTSVNLLDSISLSFFTLSRQLVKQKKTRKGMLIICPPLRYFRLSLRGEHILYR